MNLYLLWRDVVAYDTFQRAVVAANSEEDAKKIHPEGGEISTDRRDWEGTSEKVHVKLLGTAVDGTQRGPIIAEFNGEF